MRLVALLLLFPLGIPGCRPCPPLATAAPSAGTVAAVRRDRLGRGINLSVSPEEGDPLAVDDSDLALIRALGFRHVRLSVPPRALFDASRPCRLKPEGVARLDAALDRILGHTLAVIVDIHPRSDGPPELLRDDAGVEAFARFWQELAAHLSRRDPDRVFFELLNEPRTQGGLWRSALARTVPAIRARAAAHTLIVSGDGHSGIDDLTALAVLPDRNVIYNFHFYEPMVFTHQGAEWLEPPIDGLRGVPYPTAPDALARAFRVNPDPPAAAAIGRFAAAGWNAGRIRARLHAAAEWGLRHHVPVTCNEFGVYRPNAAARDRVAWTADVLRALEDADIGWTYWDYAGGFGLVIKDGGRTVVDETLAHALALALAAPPAAAAAAAAAAETP